MGKENQCTFTILSWMRFERYGETKVPKYRLAEQRGRYRPMEEALQGSGRILVRPSGTEALMRVMVEAKTPEIAKDTAQRLADLIPTLV